ncbi:MAG: DUF177 domain-containing protein [Clostridia bacterium]|nr:DUF177 domain-containing protein [Clostridia bacterium]
MMIIDIRKLNAKKEYCGQLHFDYEADNSLIGIPFVKFSAPVSVDFSYELYEDDALEIKGKVTYRIEGQCSRCLENATMTVEGELDALFEPTKDAEDYGYFGGIVRLQEAVDDAIMASMPFSLSCGENCKGSAFINKTDDQEE